MNTAAPERASAVKEFESLASRVNSFSPDHSLSQLALLKLEIVEAPRLDLLQREWLFKRLEVTADSRLWELKTDYVGPLRPMALLVGDTPGTRLPSYGAFTPWPNGCGLHLIAALHDAGLTLADVGLVNSKDVDLDSLYTELGRSPRVIALGRDAHAELDRQDIYIHGFARHPQYEKRFKHRERKAYGAQILEYATAWGTR